MKVLHAIPTYLPVIGGAEINVHNLAKFSKALDIDSTILTYNMVHRWNPQRVLETTRDGDIPVIRIPAVRPYPNVKYVRAILPLLAGTHVLPLTGIRCYFDEADLIHLHDEIDLSMAIAGRRSRVPRIYHIRTLTVRIQSYRRVPLRRWILTSSAAKFICNSNASADEMMSLGVASDQVVVIPNGVDTSIFAPNADRARSSNRLLFVGRIEYGKGLHVVFDAMRKVTSPLELTVVLSWVSDQAYYRRLRRQANDLERETEHQIVWKQRLSPEELAREYRAATVFVCPSLREAFGNVNVEAMSCGTPVVASRVGGIVDIITHGLDGLLFAPGDSEELAGALNALFVSPGARSELSANGLNTIRERFAWNIVAMRTVEAYNDLLR
jgi:glycosyltransferase involved in cell wall biosynthesis